MPIQVHNTDDRYTLTDRVCRDHRVDAHYRLLIQNKIMDALNKLLHHRNVAESLHRKIQRFVDKDEPTMKLEEVEERPSSSPKSSRV
jgi:hypothetical protein